MVAVRNRAAGNTGSAAKKFQESERILTARVKTRNKEEHHERFVEEGHRIDTAMMKSYVQSTKRILSLKT
jgi:hypothetical protein